MFDNRLYIIKSVSLAVANHVWSMMSYYERYRFYFWIVPFLFFSNTIDIHLLMDSIKGTDVRTSAVHDLLVGALLFVDVVNAALKLLNLFAQLLTLNGEHVMTLYKGTGTF